MLKFDTPQNTRIAPSPTGNAHIGFVRTAYLNYLAARSSGGEFLVRIDDTDKERSKQEYTDNILQTLEWLGLEWDNLQYQSKRYDRYKEVADRLISDGSARVDNGATYLSPCEFQNEWVDLIAGQIPITLKDHESIENLIILRSDGSPTYHFASCVDDFDMEMSLIIRGTDHISNTSKHVHLFQEFGGNTPKFAHVGLIFHNGKKISKRDGLSNMEYYRERYTPEAVLNAVLKLGWSHPDPAFDKKYPLVDKQMAIELFPEGHLKAVKSTLDTGKLDWLNKRYATK
jgi:glutamyl-tRNA synthetase